MRIVIVPNDKATPVGKLADAELHFEARDGLLTGLKLLGFAIWESQWPTKHPRYPHLRVTAPSRSYTGVSGEARNFALLRAIEGSQIRGVESAALDALSNAILDAYGQAIERSAPSVQAAAAVARQVWKSTQVSPVSTPAPRSAHARAPQPARRTNGGRYPLARPTSQPAYHRDEPPPHTDDDFAF